MRYSKSMIEKSNKLQRMNSLIMQSLDKDNKIIARYKGRMERNTQN